MIPLLRDTEAAVAALAALDDDALARHVIGHVLQAGAAGRLPALAWQAGFDAGARAALAARWPQACAEWDALAAAAPTAASAVEPPLLAPLRALLLSQRADRDPAGDVLAGAIACACFGPHHLWEDLGAGGREQVSRLLRAAVPSIVALNVRNLRWKRHLFLLLGERSGQTDLRPPKCDGCGDFEHCFGAPAPAR